MPENLFEAQYNLTRKSKIKQFYEDNKSKIFILTIIVLIVIASLTFYFYNQKKQNIIIAENYIEAKILISKKDTLEALELLKKLVISNNKTYSALSFFLILDNNLIKDQNELTRLFDNLMSSNLIEKPCFCCLIIFFKSINKPSDISIEVFANFCKKFTIFKFMDGI